MWNNSLPGVGLKLLSGPRESQSCPPTDPRREAESLGEHEGQPVTSWGVGGGNEESREKQGPERMARLGILQHDAQRARFVTTRRVTRRRRMSEPRQEKGGRVSISKQRGEAVQLHPVQSMS